MKVSLSPLLWSLLLLAVFAIGCSKSSDTTQAPEAECGIERWHVKILTDPAADSIEMAPTAMSIAEIDTFAQVTVAENTPRLNFEKKLLRVPCTIVEFKEEDDKDIHLVLMDPMGDSIIGEIPGISCAEVAGSPHANDFDNASSWIKTHLGTPTTSFKTASAAVTVTGVLFQDFDHGQKGHAKNYMELHPVLTIE